MLQKGINFLCGDMHNFLCNIIKNVCCSPDLVFQTNLRVFPFYWINCYNMRQKKIIDVHLNLQAVLNFVLYKFGHLPQREWQIMHDLAKMFLHCLNHWKLETPTVKKQHSQGEELAAYKANYTRWENSIIAMII